MDKKSGFLLMVLGIVLFLFVVGFIIVQLGYQVEESQGEDSSTGFITRFFGYLLGLVSAGIFYFVFFEGWLINGI